MFINKHNPDSGPSEQSTLWPYTRAPTSCMTLPLPLYGLHPAELEHCRVSFYLGLFISISHFSWQLFWSSILLSFTTPLHSITLLLTDSHAPYFTENREHHCSGNNKSYVRHFIYKTVLLFFLKNGFINIGITLRQTYFSSFQGDIKPLREFKLQSEGSLILCSFYYFMLPLDNKTYWTFFLICFRYLLMRRKNLKFRNHLIR